MTEGGGADSDNSSAREAMTRWKCPDSENKIYQSCTESEREW